MSGKNKRKRTLRRGGYRMRDLGYAPVQIWMGKADKELLKKASEFRDMNLAKFMFTTTMAKAKKDTGFSRFIGKKKKP